MEAFAFEHRGKTLVDSSHDAEALVDEAGVELHQPGARADFLPGVTGCEDAADADDLQFAARQTPERRDRPGRARAKRHASQAAFAERGDFSRGRLKTVAARRRVRRDDSGDARFARNVNDQLKLAFAGVWRNFY